ncbi:hypothetical protein OBBRIDRAFT_836619 [Obba rivulosa]|uniref:Uncharacterized protein n=1 Tax=Obba rivulosa TaxID=1052685 RepID=A0A8E2DIN9_9APHY|nr:hypothetical protein OBBRIDRAFT_836619 [Obba rivulosa]
MPSLVIATWWKTLVLTFGTLSFANNFPNLPNSAGQLLLPPPPVDWVVTHTGREAAMTRSSPTDFVQTIFTGNYTKRTLAGTLPEDSIATNISISHGSLCITKAPGTFAQLPSTCIVTGGAEITLGPMITLRDRMQEDMGKDQVLFIEAPDGTHDFFTAGWHEPERTDGLR